MESKSDADRSDVARLYAEDYITETLPNPGKWRICGFSKAGNRTGFILFPLKIMLDMGVSTMTRLNAVFLSHSHTDHAAALPSLSRKTGLALKQKRRLYAPKEAISPIARYLAGYMSLGSCTCIDPSTTDVYNHRCIEPAGMSVGDAFEVTFAKQRYFVEVAPCFHSVPSIAFGFSSITKKLKDEFKGKRGKELHELRQIGAELTSEVHTPQLMFFGDTSIKGLTESDVWKKYPVVMIECTMNVMPKEMRRLDEHIAWPQILPIIRENPRTFFLLTHTSKSVCTKDMDVMQMEADKLDIRNLRFWRNLHK